MKRGVDDGNVGDGDVLWQGHEDVAQATVLVGCKGRGVYRVSGSLECQPRPQVPSGTRCIRTNIAAYCYYTNV
jgi:hypothetical protein